MGTTPTLGLPYPDPGDLVQLIDEDIRDLALAVETALGQGDDPRTFVAGRYYRPPYPVTANAWAGLALNTMSYAPLVMRRTGQIDRLGANVEVVGAAGAVLRFGIYADAGGLPGNLLLDAGTAVATALGFKTVNVAHNVVKGTPLWFAIATQVAVSTARLASGVMSPEYPVGDPGGVNAEYPGYNHGVGIAGALPAASGIVAGTAAAIRVFVPYVRLV